MGSVRGQLALGAAQGLALSALVWCWALNGWTVGTVLLLLTGVAAWAIARLPSRPPRSLAAALARVLETETPARERSRGDVVPFRPTGRRRPHASA